MRISDTQSRAIFGNPSPPALVTEHQFDYFDEALQKLAETPWNEIQDSDLWYYIHDLSYMELQPELFAYMFPVCLNFWYHSLLRNSDCAAGDAEFHYALHHGQILEKHVTPDQRDQIFTFFHDGFLDRLDQERGFVSYGTKTPAQSWIWRFNSLGVVTPVIERLWHSWWRLESPGQAVCALMYLSGLMYDEGENPVFKPITSNRGGGGPYLDDNDSWLFDNGWLPVNIDFFKRILTIDYLGQKVQEAYQRLAEEPEADMARTISMDYGRLAEDVEIRIAYLIDALEKPKGYT